MAMSLQELFYDESEPVYFVHYGRQSPSTGSYPYASAMAECRSRRMELSTFDLMVPMCCNRCEDEVQDALLALRSVRDVFCDARNQRVTVTGCLDPAQALKQVRRVNSGATFWSSSYSTHQYEHQYVHQDNNSRSSHRSYSGRYDNHSRSSDRYSRSLCPAYRDSTETHYINVNPTIATRVVMEC